MWWKTSWAAPVFTPTSALRFSTPDSLFITGAGPDFERYYGAWFEHNGASFDGIFKRMERTNYNELVYLEDGKYYEYSIYGEAFTQQNSSKRIVRPSEMEPFLADTRGMYFGGTHFLGDYHDELIEVRKRHPQLKIMLEYSPKKKTASGIEPGELVLERLDAIDMFSLNEYESFVLFGVDNEKAAIKILTDLPFPVYYRVGKKGAYMIDGGRVAFVPMISVAPPGREIDPTGCGNSSTAAAMWAWLEGYDLLMTCIWGNVIAAYNALQYGPYFDMSRDNFDRAMRRAEEIYADLKTTVK